MRKIFTKAIAICFFLLPLMVNAQSDQKAAGPPPVQQKLVPEGFFAIKLADALKVGAVKSEAEAETTLTSVGISPRNGWIADYPVTPDIIVELQEAVAGAADSGKLTMNREEALKALENVTTELGLPVVASAEQSAQDQAAQSYGDYSNPSVINNYYSDEGPPVVTYYAPPPDYYYLYAWVPFPFWSAGFWFPGYFVLQDFNTVVVINKRHFFCRNHVIDPKTHRVGRIDPVTRAIGRDVRSGSDLHQARGFRSAEARRGAQGIFNRSIERGRTGDVSRNPVSGNNFPAQSNRMGARVSPRTSERGIERSPAVTQSHEFRNSFSRPNGFTGQGGMNRSERSFSAPSMGGGGFHGGGLHAGGGGGCRGRC